MTELTKPVTRFITVADLERRGSIEVLAVTLSGEGLIMRKKGKRTRYVLPFTSAWWRAADLEAQRQMREKKAARAARKQARAK